MDHIVFLDESSRELENLLLGNKTMIIRASHSCKIPYGNVIKGDILYLVDSIDSETIKARCRVSSVYCYGMLSREESFETIIRNQDKLQLPDNVFETMAGKKFLVLIGTECIESIIPMHFSLNSSEEIADWLTVGKIEEYILSSRGIISA